MRVLLYIVAAVLVSGSLAACAGGSGPGTTGYSPAVPAAREPLPANKTGKLVTVNTDDGSLAYWPISPGGGDALQQLSGPIGVGGAYNLAADGRVIAIAIYNPAQIVLYNLKTKNETTMHDPYGGALDIAIDKQHTIYAMNLTNVAVFKRGSSQPLELSCSSINNSQAIAVDNEGDVFVNGYGPAGFMGVVEYPYGSTSCKKLRRIAPEEGYAGGIGIDPKTDDLIVVDNPDLCAGGLEGRMLVYRKPYRASTARTFNLNATYCAGTIRLSADSTLIFVADSTVSAGFPIIDQRTYPDAQGTGTYQRGRFPSGYFAGFTTIPNTLPN
jgi:hypothetical protein